MNEVLIKAENVSKKFCRDFKRSLWYGMKDIGRSLMGQDHSQDDLRKDEFWAVKDINFEVRRGECLGLIGHNGAGKSTLLKMLNGLINPDQGKITMRGRIGALIELGAGFNPLLTGRENIYNNGAVLGFTRKEIDEKLNLIIDFSEIGEFIDTPVQNYSSGMKVRLGFAVAAQMEPDILLIDEVLAVGDLGFILKCFNQIDTIMEKTAVIFVSHSMPQVSRITNELLILEKGKEIFHSNDISKGIDIYYSKFSTKISNFKRSEYAELLELTVQTNEKINNVPIVKHLEDLNINIHFKTIHFIDKPYISISIFDKEQRPVGIALYDKQIRENKEYKNMEGYNHFNLKLKIPKINLSKGLYSVSFGISENIGSKPLLRIQNASQFQISSENQVWPPVEFESIWK